MNNAPADPLSWYYDIPVVTRVYLTAAFVTTAMCQLDATSSTKLFFSWPLICKGQVWRLVTNFFYFGALDVHFLFHMYFLVRYSRLLEEGDFRGRTGDFVWFLLFCASLMIGAAPYLAMNFLGRPLAFMMVYVWGRRNEHVRMNLLGMFPFTAPYLPWVLLLLSAILGSPLESDLLGIAVGHLFYFLEFVYPEVANIRGWKWKQLMRAPRIVQQLCGQVPAVDRQDVPAVVPVPDVGQGHLHDD
ncbi:unnamed protein product [Ectocarpus sp. 8 AP-2014]